MTDKTYIRRAMLLALALVLQTAHAGRQADVVVISPPAFTNVWESYTAYRRSTHPHLTFEIKNTDEIYAAYPDATNRTTFAYAQWLPDHALAIHKYIEAAAAAGTTTVILGAEPPVVNTACDIQSQVPIRYAINSSIYGTDDTRMLWVPTDLYYACLDKNGGEEVWDAQGDGVYCGTGERGTYNPVTDTAGMDWEADIVVMRMPLAETFTVGDEVYSAAQIMTAYTNKLARGESPSFTGAHRYQLVGGKEAVGSSTPFYWMRNTRTYLQEYEFFDGAVNMFSPDHARETKTTEVAVRWAGQAVFAALRGAKSLNVAAGGLLDDPNVVEAYENELAHGGDGYYIYGHGHRPGLDDGLYTTTNVWQWTSLYKFCFAASPCLTGKIDSNPVRHDAGDPDPTDDKFADGTTFRCVAQAGIFAPDGGFLVSFNNTRNGIMYNRSNIEAGANAGIDYTHTSPRLDLTLLRYIHGYFDRTEYPAGLALLKTRRACADMTDGDSESFALMELTGYGDPFVTVTPQRDRTWAGADTGGTWSADVGAWVSSYSVTNALVDGTGTIADDQFGTTRRVFARTDADDARYTVAGSHSASEIRLEGPAGGAFAIEGGTLRSFNLVSVTNASTLTWASTGGAAHDGVEFVGDPGRLVLPGNAKRYFGTNFTNVAAIDVTGSNVTLDFSASVVDCDLSFTGGGTSSTNTLRSSLDNSAARLAAGRTIAVKDSTLLVESSGLFTGAAGAAAIAATNAVVTVGTSPLWESVCLERAVKLNSSSVVIDFNRIRAGGSAPWKIHAEGGESSLIITDRAVSCFDWDVNEDYFEFSGAIEYDVAAGAVLVTELDRAPAVAVSASLAGDARLVFITTAATLDAARSTPKALCTLAEGAAAAPFYTNVSFRDAAGSTLATPGLFTYEEDGVIYLGATPTPVPQDIVVSEGETLAVGSGTMEFASLTVYGTVSVTGDGAIDTKKLAGTGRIEYTGRLPDDLDWTGSDWKGVLVLKSLTGDSSEFPFNTYGNAGSAIEFNGVTGYKAPCTVIEPELIVGPGGASFAGGTFGNATTWKKLSGTGSLTAATHIHIIHDALAFTGDITNSGAYIGFGTTNRYDTSRPAMMNDNLKNKIYIESDAKVSARPGAVWNASSMVMVNGPVNLVTTEPVSDGLVVITNALKWTRMDSQQALSVNGMTNGAFTVATNATSTALIVNASSTGYTVPTGGRYVTIPVDSDWITEHIDKAGAMTAAAIQAKLDSVAPNGVKYWANYAAGLNPENGQLKVTAFEHDATAGRYRIKANWDPSGARDDSGLGARIVLEEAGDIDFTESRESGCDADGTFTVDTDDAAKKFYRLKIKFQPLN